MNHSATLTIVRDNNGERIVVTEADEVIWLADDLMREITAQSYPPPRLGEPVMSGDLLTFGTPGEGMGQLTYRLAGRNDQGWHVAHREPDHPQP